MADTPLLRDDKGRLLPGQGSLNPGGRPRGRTATIALLRDALDNATTPEKAAEFAQVLLDAAVRGARTGNVKAASLYARMYGLLEDKINVSGSAVSWNWQPGGGRSAPADTEAGDSMEQEKDE